MFTIDDYLYVLYATAVENAAKVLGVSPDEVIEKDAVEFCGGKEFIDEIKEKDSQYSELVETMKDVFSFKYRKGKRLLAKFSLTVLALNKVPLPKKNGIVVSSENDKTYYELVLRRR